MKTSDRIRLNLLRRRLKDHDRLYWLGKPAISDLEYCRLYREAQDLEQKSEEPTLFFSSASQRNNSLI